MFRVHVFIKVKPEGIEAFKAASFVNAQNSRMEEGVIAFDVIQSQEDPTEFVLEETYVSDEAQLKHRETLHFKRWKSDITPLIVQDYTVKKFHVII